MNFGRIGLVAALLLSSNVWASDLGTLESARASYNKGQYQKAVDTYSKIQKSSDYYVDAMEEKAQALGQQGKYAEALAELKSTFAPQFEGLVGPSVYLTETITELKTCNYPGVLESSKKFKEAFIPRLKNLKEVAEADISPIRTAAFEAASKKKAVSIESLGPLVRKLPRNTIKEKSLSKLLNNPEAFELKLQALARAEMKEIESVINRMEIAEVEVEHRLNVMSTNNKRSKQGGYEKSSDVLVFPADDEVWIDEIGHYKAEVENCPDLTRRAGI